MRYFIICVIFLSTLTNNVMAQVVALPAGALAFSSEHEERLFKSDDDVFALMTALHAEPSLNNKSWQKLLHTLDKKSKKKHYQEWFVQQIFYQSHRQLLKTYEKHATFNDVLTSGTYDCVSGSAVLGLLLDRYGFEHQVVETDYHVFIKLDIGEKTIVLESTEPLHGFISDQNSVDKFLQSFKEAAPVAQTDLKIELGSLLNSENGKSIYNEIGIHQLAGLQYYNDAVYLFNQESYELCYRQLVKAAILYPSKRILKFRDLMEKLRAIQEDD